MKNFKKLLSLACCVSAAAGLAGCAGVEVSNYAANDSYKLNQPVKSDGCYDAAVLLGKNAAETKEIAKKVLVALDAGIDMEADTVIKAQRNRYIGLVVGSGGEELSVTMKAVSPASTFVTATTKTGFVGGAGQKAWSCEIVDQMAKMAGR